MGRPLSEVDWTEAGRLASYHCTQQEIADFFEVSINTLERACIRDLGTTFGEFFAQKKGQLKPRLRKIQWTLALQGNASMAIFLGKQHLNQVDTPADVAILEAIQQAGMTKDQALELIRGAADKIQAMPKRSYEDFVAVAGYPPPKPPQIDMYKFGLEETVPRMILGARGYGKTDYVTIMGVAYDLYLNPRTATNLIITKSRERNASMINEIRMAAEKNGVAFDIANQSTLRVHGLEGKDHSVSAVTVKTISLRGRHPKRVIMDDPVTEDDTSEATRATVKAKWNEINKLVSNILVIGQPAHKYDLYADLRPKLKKMELPYGTIPSLDPDLDAQRLAGVDEASISMSYKLIVPDEGTIPFDGVKYIDQFPKGDTAVAFIDPSHEGGDFTAISIVKMYMQGVAVVGYLYKKAWNHCLDEMTSHLRAHNVARLAFETNALGDQPVIMLREAMKDTGIGIVGRKSLDNKHARIMNAGAYAHLIHLAKESHSAYIKQVVQYEYGAKNDDAPDSLASCLAWIGLIRSAR